MPAFAQAEWPPPLAAERPNVEAAVTAALRMQIEEGRADPEVAAFYRARGFAPLWAPGELRPQAYALAEALGLEPPRAGPHDPWALAGQEIRLSEAFAARARRGPEGGEGRTLAYVDPALGKAPGRARAALEALAAAPDLDAHLASALEPRHRIYRQLEEGLHRYRASWGSLPAVHVPEGPELGPGASGPRVAALRARLGQIDFEAPYDASLEAAVRAFQRAHGLAETGRADAATLAALNAGPQHYEQLVLANLERAKALPADFGERFILVDAAAGQLWYYDEGQQRAAMKVVTGKPSQPTPMMAGMVSHLIFNPYWNVPEDLVRDSIAPKVLEHGLSYVADEGLEVLSDYTENAASLDPAAVDWKAVAAGTLSVRVRQRPGPKNMMGKVKLMLPNPLGIYLHDTPHKGDFARSQRLASSGCVRLEDAMSLAELLVGEAAAEAALASGEEQRVDLPEPVPVYITYFTAMPTNDGFVFRPDVYGRDAGWVRQQQAALGAGGG